MTTSPATMDLRTWPSIADHLYDATRTPEIVRVPSLSFLMVDGHGDPNDSDEYRAAIQVLYGLSYTLKFAIKKEIGSSYRVGPLEGLWWSDDMADFSAARKDDWHWTAMIAQPDTVTLDRLARAIEGLRRKRPLAATDRIRLARFEEGLAGQVLHIGPYRDEGPTIERLHAFIHERGFSFDGRREKHHEIYLGDPRRAAPEKLRTIIRQPVDVA
ncbi:MAG TPA: GyrI-like domain-containing protein [Candidatus Limnocylindrales bacterium]|nr:GyrI-like domain-containing protein [Candidatus Limnocylindrales bacterium]